MNLKLREGDVKGVATHDFVTYHELKVTGIDSFLDEDGKQILSGSAFLRADGELLEGDKMRVKLLFEKGGVPYRLAMNDCYITDVLVRPSRMLPHWGILFERTRGRDPIEPMLWYNRGTYCHVPYEKPGLIAQAVRLVGPSKQYRIKL